MPLGGEALLRAGPESLEVVGVVTLPLDRASILPSQHAALSGCHQPLKLVLDSESP